MLLLGASSVSAMLADGTFQPDFPPRQRPAGWIHGLRGSTLPRLGPVERRYQRVLAQRKAVKPDAQKVTTQTADVVDVTNNMSQLTLSDQSMSAPVFTINIINTEENASTGDAKKPEQEPVAKVSFKPLLDCIQAACDEKNAHVQKPDKKVLGIIKSHFDSDMNQTQFWQNLQSAMRTALSNNMTITLEVFGQAICWWFRHNESKKRTHIDQNNESKKITHIDQIIDKNKKTLLHVYANHKKKQVCEFLIAAGSSIDSRDSNEVSPLMYAVDNSRQERYEFFFERFPRKAYDELKELTRRKECILREARRSLTGFEWYEKAWCVYYTVIVNHLKAQLPPEFFEPLIVELTLEVFLREVQKEIAHEIDLASKK